MPIVIPPPVDREWEGDRFAAEMTDRQFRSIETRIDPLRFPEEVAALPRAQSGSPSSACNPQLARRWLLNGWNTEHILSQSWPVLEGAGGAALQWSFPQAYYAVFAHTLAFFQVAGFSETSHAAVQRKFAELVAKGEYPPSLTFYATGTKKNMLFHGLEPNEGDLPSIHFNPNDEGSTDRHIAQFLRSTRKTCLDSRKATLKLRTKKGAVRRRYREEDWRVASERQGPTTLLCFLYRKRIKANYRDIDTFTAEGFDPTRIGQALETIVRSLALTHETFIAARLGREWYRDLAEKYLASCESDGLSSRKETVLKLVDRRAAL